MDKLNQKEVIRLTAEGSPLPGAASLAELSAGYRAAGVLLSRRLRALRRALAAERNAQERAALRSQISALSTVYTQCRKLEELTAHYYERGFYRDESYTL